MVFYAYLQRHALIRRHRRGFSLLEIVLVLFVLGILAASMTPTVRDVVEKSRRMAELKTLDELAQAISDSFAHTDLNQLNIAALPGTIGATDIPTRFSTSTAIPPATTTDADWFTKIARLRGLTPIVGRAPTASVQPELAQLVFNGLRNPRLLLAGPSEPGQQRFLLLSLMARPERLTLPSYESTSTWFDAIWNHDWESFSAALPTSWAHHLTPEQANAWESGSGGTTQVHLLCVRRIVLPKFRITVNNNHPTEAAFVSYNNTTNAFTAAPGSGANVTPEILAGRLITINRGASAPGIEALRFHLRENATVTVQ